MTQSQLKSAALRSRHLIPASQRGWQTIRYGLPEDFSVIFLLNISEDWDQETDAE